MEQHAPGFAGWSWAATCSPRPTWRRENPSLVGGALGGGTAAAYQQLFLRPIPGLGRADTPVDRLFLASASAHPGGGVHGAPGANAARAALARDRGADRRRCTGPRSTPRTGPSTADRDRALRPIDVRTRHAWRIDRRLLTHHFEGRHPDLGPVQVHIIWIRTTSAAPSVDGGPQGRPEPQLAGAVAGRDDLGQPARSSGGTRITTTRGQYDGHDHRCREHQHGGRHGQDHDLSYMGATRASSDREQRT